MDIFSKKNKSNTKEYFNEARSWDKDRIDQKIKSEKRAWLAFFTISIVAVCEAIGIAGILPLKTVVPFVIKYETTTGFTDVVNVLNAENIDVEEAMNKYWLSLYIRHREGYLWATRAYDREMVGLLSSSEVQAQYANYTNPQKNPYAPVSIYGDTAEVATKVTSISMLNTGERVNKEKRYTALVRYIKKVSRVGETASTTHWAATITFTYRNTPMKIEDRLKNPLGYQVVNYRNDQETGGNQ